MTGVGPNSPGTIPSEPGQSTSSGDSGETSSATDTPSTASDGGVPSSPDDGATAPDASGDSPEPPDVNVPEPGSLLPGDVLFSRGEVLTFSLTLTDADWQQLEQNGIEEVYVPGAVEVVSDTFPKRALPQVGVRYKGSWTLDHCWSREESGERVRLYGESCDKLSFKVKFTEYDDSGRIDGLKRINLHAMQTDRTSMHELIAYSTYQEFGVEAPRVLPAKVYVNGVFRGLYMAVEDVDGRFTKAHFPAGGDGNLYKETWPHPDLGEYNFLLALETNEELADVSDMVALSEAVGAATDANFEETVGALLDIEHTLRFLAVDRAINNWDSVMSFYAGLSPHNFYWYHDAGDSELFRLVPWDVDNTLDRDPFTDPHERWGVAPLPDWNVNPSHCEKRPIWDPDAAPSLKAPRCDPLLDLLARTQWPEYDVLGRQLLVGPFSLATLQAKVDRWRPLLAPIIAEDPTLDVELWQGYIDEMRDEVFPALVTEFEAFLDEGLVDESPSSAQTGAVSASDGGSPEGP